MSKLRKWHYTKGFSQTTARISNQHDRFIYLFNVDMKK